MALMEKDTNAACAFKGARSYQTNSETAVESLPVPTGVDGQDEHLWESAIANSIDAIRDLADKARAERRAGRTKKITL